MMNEKFLKPRFNKIISKDLNIDNTSRFTVEKLDRGFGQTLGVAMRRTLISSIPGVAVFAVEIKGVSHEFQAIKDVKEDAVEFILNVKKLILEVDENAIKEDEVIKLELTSKSGTVKAKDIDAPAEIRIINTDLVLAHTSKDKALDVTFYVAYSKGFKSFEENRILVKEKIGEKRGILPIDANFSPIEKVLTHIEEVNPGESRVFERLILDVTTRGNITPEKAVAFAGAILRNHYAAFETMHEVNIDEDFVEEKVVQEDNSDLQTPIEQLNLSVRSENALKAAGIKTIGQLIDRTISDLKNIDNLGAKSVNELIELVKEMGLAFKSE